MLFRSKEFLSLISACQVYVNNGIVKIPHNFDEVISLYMEKYYELPEKSVKVYEHRLKAACHNQWKLVNSGQLKSSIAMTNADDILKCNGIPTIDNVFLHPSIGLIFQLEYTLILERSEKDLETLHVVVAEYMMNLSYDSSGEFEAVNLSSLMNTNPERSITGNLIFNFIEKLADTDFILMCEVSPNKGMVAFSTHAELLSHVSNKRNLELEHKKKLEDLKRQEAKESLAISGENFIFSPKKTGTGFVFSPKTDVKQTTMKSALKSKKDQPRIPQAMVTLSKSQKPITATTKKMLQTTIGNAIPRNDTVVFFGKGYNGILSDDYVSHELPNIEEDRIDSLKANVIFFEFMGFRAINPTVPRKLSFLTKFFKFPETRTDAVMLESTGTDLYKIGRAHV